MRTLIDRLGWGLAGATTVTLVLVLAGVVSAGPLDPTGPPSAPSGVFGAGTPISSLPYTISTPGSYYVTGNLAGVTGQNGILIMSDDVSLDLRGFTLSGVPGSGDGVRADSGAFRRAITVRNGTLRGWAGSGLQAQFIDGGVFDTLTAEGNAQWGLIIGAGGTLTHCSATRNGAAGINASQAVVSDCTSQRNTGQGFQINLTLLTNCHAEFNGSHGIDAASTSKVDGCYVYQNTGAGINADSSVVTNNEVSQNSATGIVLAGSGGSVARNNVSINSITGVGAGIAVTGSQSRVEGNHVTDFGMTPSQEIGINVSGNGNVVFGNTAHMNGLNYSLTGSFGSYGPLISATIATNPFSNIDY